MPALGHDAAAPAFGAHDGHRAGLGARAAARLAVRRHLDGHLRRDALEGVLEREVDDSLDVTASAAAPIATATLSSASEHAAEQISQVEHVAQVAEGARVEARAALAAGEHAGAELVVLLALLRVAEDVVGGRDLLEALLGVLAAGVALVVIGGSAGRACGRPS